MQRNISFHDKEKMIEMIMREKGEGQREQEANNAIKEYKRKRLKSNKLVDFVFKMPDLMFEIISTLLTAIAILDAIYIAIIFIGNLILVAPVNQIIPWIQHGIFILILLNGSVIFRLLARNGLDVVLEKSMIYDVLQDALKTTKTVRVNTIIACSGSFQEPTEAGDTYIELTDKSNKSNTAICEIQQIPEYLGIKNSSIQGIEESTIYYIELSCDGKTAIYLVCFGIISSFEASTIPEKVSLFQRVTYS